MYQMATHLIIPLSLYTLDIPLPVVTAIPTATPTAAPTLAPTSCPVGGVLFTMRVEGTLSAFDHLDFLAK